MYSWPADCKKRDGDTVQQKGTRKHNANKGIDNFPHLVPGALGALSLHERGNRLEWTSLLKKSQGCRLLTGNSVDIFPATRPPRLSVPRTTIHQRSERGVNFLRTHLPDVDIASDLIRDHLSEDARVAHSLEAFDPHVGNLLDVVYFPDAHSNLPACLAFPMGELNRDLNLSPFSYDERKDVVFRPTATSSYTFDTPIRQIVSSYSSPRPPDEVRRENAHLAVRTFGATSVFEVETVHNSSLTPPSVRISDLVKFISSDVGKRPIVDVNLSQLTLEGGVLVNEIGDVYKYDIDEGRLTPRLVCPNTRMPADPVDDGFWRLALTGTGQGCLLASNKYLNLVDFRMNYSCLDLFSVQNDMITAIKRPRGDHIFQLVSTSEVLWIDERFTQTPLLGYMHGREFDRSLDLLSIDLPTPLTFLTSRRNGLVTVYDVSRAADHLIHVNTPPYSLPFLYCDERHGGRTFFQHPSNQNQTEIGLFQLCERGSIHRTSLGTSFGDVDHSATGARFRWSEDVKELARNVAELRPYIGPLAGQDSTKINFRNVYELLFVEENKRCREDESLNLDKIPTFWQSSEAVPKSMFTMFNIAFRCEAPCHTSRADFLVPCALNSSRGFQALEEGSLSPEQLIESASWSHNIQPILEQHDVDIADNPMKIVDNLRHYEPTFVNPSPESVERTSYAREQLALDLALSTNIFSSRTISNPSTVRSNPLETMTEALSLGDEPPPIRFGYLQPILKREDEEAGHKGPAYPAGVRLLLKDWVVGTDSVPNTARSNAKVPDPVTSHRPYHHPEFEVARYLPPDFQFASQPNNGGSSDIGGSQGNITSTRIVPGVFGSRVKKRSVKRLSGF